MTVNDEYEAYLFDLDGTLVDTAPDLAAALNFTLSSIGLAHVDESLTRHWVGYGAKMLIKQALLHHWLAPANDKASDDKAEQAANELLSSFLEFYQDNIAVHSAPYPGVVDTLQRLKDQNKRLAVVTNKLRSLSMPLLDQLKLLAFFDVVVGGDTAQHPKPHPAPVLLAASQLDISIQQGLFVGDSTTDIDGASGAGMHVVCMRDGYHHGLDLEKEGANRVIDHFSELLALRPSNFNAE